MGWAKEQNIETEHVCRWVVDHKGELWLPEPAKDHGYPIAEIVATITLRSIDGGCHGPVIALALKRDAATGHGAMEPIKVHAIAPGLKIGADGTLPDDTLAKLFAMATDAARQVGKLYASLDRIWAGDYPQEPSE